MKQSWPKLVEVQTAESRNFLCQNLHFSGKEKSEVKNFLVRISGVPCMVSKEQAGEMLRVALQKEQEEYLALCKKYKSLDLKWEAILKTKFFNQVVRRADVQKDFFYFETFDEEGTVFADLRNLSKKNIFNHEISEIIDQINNLDPIECEKGEIFNTLMRDIFKIVNDMKKYLWPKHTDVMLNVGKRRIQIVLPKAPAKTESRLIDWKMKGFSLSTVAHCESFNPIMPSYFNVLWDASRRKIDLFRELGYNTTKFKKFHERLEDDLGATSSDPIFYLKDGEWTVIVDQYADFPKEKEVIQVVKDHYNLLGQRYGILDSNDN